MRDTFHPGPAEPDHPESEICGLCIPGVVVGEVIPWLLVVTDPPGRRWALVSAGGETLVEFTHRPVPDPFEGGDGEGVDSDDPRWPVGFEWPDLASAEMERMRRLSLREAWVLVTRMGTVGYDPTGDHDGERWLYHRAGTVAATWKAS